MKSKVIMVVLLVLISGFSVAQGENFQCNSSSVGDSQLNVSTSGSQITFSGVYCARTEGFAITNQETISNNSEIRYNVGLTSSSSDEFVPQVLTPVNFSKSLNVEPGNYSINFNLQVDGETIKTSEQAVNVKNDKGLIAAFLSWLFNLI